MDIDEIQSIDLPLTDSNKIVDKYELLKDLIDKIEIKKNKQYKNYKKLRKFTSFVDTTSNILNSITVSSVITTLTITQPYFLIITCVCSSTTLLLQAGRTGYNADMKKEKYSTSYHQYTDLLRGLKARLAKNNLSSVEIEDSSLE